MLEITPLPIHTSPILKESRTLFRFVLRVGILILSQFVNPMGKLALKVVVAEPVLHEVFTELVFQLLVPLVLWFVGRVLVSVIMLVHDIVILRGIVSVVVRARGFSRHVTFGRRRVVDRVLVVSTRIHHLMSLPDYYIGLNCILHIYALCVILTIHSPIT